ncbi:MAG: hypothetical protein EOO73_19300 [Myxococcales bacterium]|nr:MAG: hypothetical protein EOO73_19300 [Myxococcales bacterium]
MSTNVVVARFRFRARSRQLFAVAGAALFGFVSPPARAAQWQTKVSYGGSTTMDLYVPDMVDPSPGVVVSLHYCGGNSGSAHGWFQAFADQYGFVVIAPGAGGNCFDASPSRSGERDAITRMVSYVITQNHADASRVFAAGASSGACMTNALLAAYPDVFAAGAALAAVPAGAWTGGNAYGWTTPANRTAQQWGDIVRMANPGYTGARPRVQLWHGTADTTLNYSPNFEAEVAQWTNVFAVTDASATQESFKGGQDTWARTVYEDGGGKVVLETNVAQGAPHDLSGRGLWRDVVRFFGLDTDVGTGGGAGGGGGGGGGAGNASGGGAAGGATGGAAAGTGTTSGGLSGGNAAGSSSGAAGQPVSGGGGTSSASGTNAVSGSGSASGGAASNAPEGPTPQDGGCGVHGSGRRHSLAAMFGLGAAWLAARRRRASCRSTRVLFS